MHEKQIPMQEWNCMKCPGRVVGDQFLNSQHAWACWDMVARAIVFEIPRMTVKCTLSVTKWIDNLSSVLDTDGVKQKTSLIFVQGKSAWYCFMVFSFVFVKCQDSHHSHPLHPLITWIYCECKFAEWIDLVESLISACRLISWNKRFCQWNMFNVWLLWKRCNFPDLYWNSFIDFAQATDYAVNVFLKLNAENWKCVLSLKTVIRIFNLFLK